MKMTMSRDGRSRASIRIQHRLDTDELVDVLCAGTVSFESASDLPEMTRAELENEIRKSLSEHGTDFWSWVENVEDDAAETYRQWAREQITRHLAPKN